MESTPVVQLAFCGQVKVVTSNTFVDPEGQVMKMALVNVPGTVQGAKPVTQPLEVKTRLSGRLLVVDQIQFVQTLVLIAQ